MKRGRATPGTSRGGATPAPVAAPAAIATPAPAVLTVLYDGDCAVCRRATAWLKHQPSYVPLEFIRAGGDVARRRYPQLDPADTLKDMAVVAGNGAVYRGSNAWVMCLWALRDHRHLAYRLSTPAMAPRARQFVAWFSEHRGWLGSDS
jgi:predicted DCC family thiol-disulfide oxidoreductase YuxK